MSSLVEITALFVSIQSQTLANSLLIILVKLSHHSKGWTLISKSHFILCEETNTFWQLLKAILDSLLNLLTQTCHLPRSSAPSYQLFSILPSLTHMLILDSIGWRLLSTTKISSIIELPTTKNQKTLVKISKNLPYWQINSKSSPTVNEHLQLRMLFIHSVKSFRYTTQILLQQWIKSRGTADQPWNTIT